MDLHLRSILTLCEIDHRTVMPKLDHLWLEIQCGCETTQSLVYLWAKLLYHASHVNSRVKDGGTHANYVRLPTTTLDLNKSYIRTLQREIPTTNKCALSCSLVRLGAPALSTTKASGLKLLLDRWQCFYIIHRACKVENVSKRTCFNNASSRRSTDWVSSTHSEPSRLKAAPVNFIWK